MIAHICTSAKADCYALGWSYGEICCHCGCCSDDPKIRIPAREKYIQFEIDCCKNFDGWDENPEWRKIQEENNASSLASWEKELAALKKEQEAL